MLVEQANLDVEQATFLRNEGNPRAAQNREAFAASARTVSGWLLVVLEEVALRAARRRMRSTGRAMRLRGDA